MGKTCKHEESGIDSSAKRPVVARTPWQRPRLVGFDAAAAEVGNGIGTDGGFTTS